jgi:hypothetical protein
MIEQHQEPMEVMAEFMSPFEQDLNIVLIGDGIKPSRKRQLKTGFNNVRKLLNQMPSMYDSQLKPVTFNQYKTQDLYRGAAEEKMKEYCLVYLAPEISSQLISILTKHDKDVDDLDAMLIDKFILQAPQEKYIFDLTQTDNDMVNQMMNGMDERPEEFNYILYGDLLGIWIYWVDPFITTQAF